MSSGTRYSSKYPLSGLVVCAECGSKYTRATWYEEGGKKKMPVWRCGERMKTGTKKCKSSPSLKEDRLYSLILNQIQRIMEVQIDTSSSPVLQTKALIASYIGGSKIEDFEMTKAMWDSIIESVIIKGKDKAVIHFKTDMTQEMTLC